jgi:hypothetical protein
LTITGRDAYGHTELREKTVQIGDEPRFGDPVAFDPEKIDAGPLHASARRRHTFEFSAVCPFNRVPDRNLLLLRDDVVDRHMQVRKPAQMSVHVLLHAIAWDRVPVDDGFAHEQAIDDHWIVMVEPFFEPAEDERFVGGDRLVRARWSFTSRDHHQYRRAERGSEAQSRSHGVSSPNTIVTKARDSTL